MAEKNSKKTRGRPGLDPETVLARAEDHRMVLNQIWDKVSRRLTKCTTEIEIADAIKEELRLRKRGPAESGPFCVMEDFNGDRFLRGTMPGLLRETLLDPDFPKRRRESQISFTADSLGADLPVTLPTRVWQRKLQKFMPILMKVRSKKRAEAREEVAGADRLFRFGKTAERVVQTVQAPDFGELDSPNQIETLAGALADDPHAIVHLVTVRRSRAICRAERLRLSTLKLT